MNAAALRAAQLQDAPAIADLFRQAYAAGPGAAVEYPYPQLLTTEGVRELMQQPDIVWRVAEGAERVVGSFGSILYRDAPLVGAAELFGLVVDPEARRQGVGSRLFRDVVATLKERGAAVILSDTRTRDAGGIRIVRAAGFEPVGYVPAGHRTPGGSEAMLACAWVHAERASSTPPSARLPPRAFELWEAFESNRAPSGAARVTAVCRSPAGALGARVSPAPSPSVVRGAAQSGSAARTLIRGLRSRRAEVHPGVHLPGLGGRAAVTDRFIEAAVVASNAGQDSGALIARFDRADQRIRVLDLAALNTPIWFWLLDWVEEWRQNRCQSGTHAPALTIDVRADAEAVLAGLEQRGYAPTTLHPGLLEEDRSGRPRRVDAFRFELSAEASSPIPKSVRAWPEAFAIARTRVD